MRGRGNGVAYSRSIISWPTVERCRSPRPTVTVSIIHRPNTGKYKYKKLSKLFYSP